MVSRIDAPLEKGLALLISTEAAVPNTKRVTPSIRHTAEKSLWVEGALSHLSCTRIDCEPTPGVVRFPERLSRDVFYTVAYPLMFLSRRMEERMVELYRKGYVKGTVTTGVGNEATALGFALPLRPGCDVVSIMHRDFLGHLLLGSTPHQLFCQYMANAEDALGLSVIGDGGTSTGEFHESLNLAAIHRVPVLFLIENNYYSFSTPISAQYTCKQLSDRAKGFV